MSNSHDPGRARAAAVSVAGLVVVAIPHDPAGLIDQATRAYLRPPDLGGVSVSAAAPNWPGSGLSGISSARPAASSMVGIPAGAVSGMIPVADRVPNAT